MHRCKCLIQDGDAPFYTLPLVILTKMKHHFRGRRAVLEGDVQPLVRQETRADMMMMGRRTDGTIAHKLWRYQVTVD